MRIWVGVAMGTLWVTPGLGSMGRGHCPTIGWRLRVSQWQQRPHMGNPQEERRALGVADKPKRAIQPGRRDRSPLPIANWRLHPLEHHGMLLPSA